MNAVYERINALCGKRGTTYSAVCRELGLIPSTIGNLKNSESRTLSYDTALMLAEYFGVTVGYILKGDISAVTSGGEISEDDIKAAFWGGEKDLTPEDIEALWQEAKDYIEYATQRKKKKK